MSKYTAQLRELIYLFGEEEIAGWFKQYDMSDYLSADEIAVINTRGVWNPDKLAKKIIDQFFMREIGQETPALFKIRVRAVMNRIMERKLPLIYSASIKYDPMVNVDFVETYSEKHDDTSDTNHNIKTTTTANSESETDNTTNGTSLAVNSDTPQGQINKEKILDGSYATSTSANESETSGNSTDKSSTSGNSTEDGTNKQNASGTKSYERKQKGNSGTLTTAQALIQQYRDTIIGIDSDILTEMETLFIGLY